MQSIGKSCDALFTLRTPVAAILFLYILCVESLLNSFKASIVLVLPDYALNQAIDGRRVNLLKVFIIICQLLSVQKQQLNTQYVNTSLAFISEDNFSG